MSKKNKPENKKLRREAKRYDRGYPEYYQYIQHLQTLKVMMVPQDKAHRLTNPQIKLSRRGIFVVGPQYGMYPLEATRSDTFKDTPINKLNVETANDQP